MKGLVEWGYGTDVYSTEVEPQAHPGALLYHDWILHIQHGKLYCMSLCTVYTTHMGWVTIIVLIMLSVPSFPYLVLSMETGTGQRTRGPWRMRSPHGDDFLPPVTNTVRPLKGKTMYTREVGWEWMVDTAGANVIWYWILEKWVSLIF